MADVTSVPGYALGPVNPGDAVILTSVDRYGLMGRDAEPPPAAEGAYGIVIGPAEPADDEGVYFYAVALRGYGPFVLADYELARAE